MDKLPTDQNSDFSGYSGSYPVTPEPAPVAQNPLADPPMQSSAPQPQVPIAPAVTPPPAFDAAEQVSSFASQYSQPQQPVFQSPPPAPNQVFSPPQTQLPDLGTSAAGPFVKPVSDNSDNPHGGGLRRLLLFLLLVIVLISVGYASFTLIGKVLTTQKQTVINYWGLWEDEAVITPVIAAFEQQHPGIDIVYSKQSIQTYRERLERFIADGKGPDIFRFHNTWVPMLKEELAPAGTTGYSASEFNSTFYPVANRDLVIGGKVYGVPLMIDGLGMYYNEDLFRAAGVAPPRTWDEFNTVVQTLTVKQNGKIDTAGAALGTTNNVEHFSDIVALLMLQNGADLKNPTTALARDALSFYAQFSQAPNNVWDGTLDNSILAFANGKVAIIFAPSWQAPVIKQLNPGLKFKIEPVPQVPNKPAVSWASYWVEGVSAKSPNQEIAWEFLKYMSSKEQMVSFYSEVAKDKNRIFGEPYSRLDLATTISSDALVGAYVQQAPIAQSFFLSSRTFDNGINDQMNKYVLDAVNSYLRGTSADAALSTMAQGFTQVLSRYTSSSAR